MATAIDIVRAIIQDQPVSVQETLVFDGVQTTHRTRFFPIIESSVTVTGVAAPDSVDGQSGLLTWTVAPAVGNYLFVYAFVQLVDSTIQIYLDLQAADDESAGDSDSYRLASAMALDAIASSQVLILKKIEILDLKTDGPAMAKALREHAAALRTLVFEGGEDTFDIIEQVNDLYGWREKVLKDALRGGQ